MGSNCVLKGDARLVLWVKLLVNSLGNSLGSIRIPKMRCSKVSTLADSVVVAYEKVDVVAKERVASARRVQRFRQFPSPLQRTFGRRDTCISFIIIH